MRLILSRKGFDTQAGGRPSPIFPDGTMLSLPIPDRHFPVRYEDLHWRGRNLGDIVEALTRGRRRCRDGAHLDPDLRQDVLPRPTGWRPSLGQVGTAQGHLRRMGVGAGDIFLFWGSFREVDDDLRGRGPTTHRIWGWLQVGEVLPVDAISERQRVTWPWLAKHPHLARRPDPSNTLYLAADRLSLPGLPSRGGPGAGVFDTTAPERCLTAADARTPSSWDLPLDFIPRDRPPLTFHGESSRWSVEHGRARLRVVVRGQEFVLDLDEYPEVRTWVAGLLSP